MKYKSNGVYETDMKAGLIILACILAVLLTGCNCTAGSDAISATVCTTDSQLSSTDNASQ